MKTLYAIQAYRGYAAVFVLLHHTNFIMGKYSMDTPLSRFFRFGHAGVEFFFVLSGFILYHTYCNRDKSCDIRSFLTSRFIRIYPLYWAVTLAFLPVWLLRPSFGEPYHREISSIITSLLLIPQEHSPHLIAAWSLTHEVLFYLFFLLIIMHRKAGIVVSGLVFTITVFFNIFSSNHDFPAVFYLSKYNILFLLGIFTGLIIKNIGADKKTEFQNILMYSIFFAGNALFLMIGLLDNSLPVEGRFTWLFGAASAMLIIGSCSHGINSFFEKRKISFFIGTASYSIYLIHIFVIEFLCKRIQSSKLYGPIPNNIIFWLLALSGIISGCFLYVMFEKRIFAWMKNKYMPSIGIKGGNASFIGFQPNNPGETI